MSRGLSFAPVSGILKAKITPTSLSKSIGSAGTATTSAATLDASQQTGSGVFSGSWSTPGFTANSPSSLTSTFSKSLSAGEMFTGTATGTLFDKATGQSAPASIPVMLTAGSPPPGPNFDFTPNPVTTMTRSGAGAVSTPVSVVIISGTGGPYTATFSINGTGSPTATKTGDLDVTIGDTLGALQSHSGVLFATVTDANNGGVSNGAINWSSEST